MGKALYSSSSLPSMLMTFTRSSVVQSFSLPPPLRGSAKVYRPTVVMVPMLWAAMSRYMWEMTPWGRL